MKKTVKNKNIDKMMLGLGIMIGAGAMLGYHQYSSGSMDEMLSHIKKHSK